MTCETRKRPAKTVKPWTCTCETPTRKTRGKGSTGIVFQGPVRSGFLAFFGQDRDRTGLQKFPFWEKTEPDWEKPVYIGPVLDICQL